ncbi:unnamed protein product [Rhizoctonia solani]|uniref:CHAT domain-containing protein n=1 Tax=Rhizoctonia solani TaxID=456999 RepID=A0A8H3D4N0_9AGAM|nr:unnamed protein product [Rhizoctonia solani]
MSHSTVTPETPSTVNGHANSHHSVDMNDMDKDIEIKAQAMLQNPNDLYSLGFLAESYYRRFRQRRVPSDLDRCIEYFTFAIPHAPTGNPDLYGILNSLGICHHQRFHLLGELEDLDKEIAWRTQAILLDGTDPALNIGLGRAYQTRFQRLGDPGDLEKCLEYDSQAILLTDNDDPNLPARLDSLSNAHLLRFQLLDDPSELDKGVECQTRAASLTPPGHRYFAGRLNNLSSSFNMRYNRYGDANDLIKSIEYSVHALSLTTDSSLQFTVLTNLSILKLLRFQLFKRLEDIEKGIEYSACALSLTTTGDHPDETLRLKHLGELYYARFATLSDPSDLDMAIESVSRATSLLSNEDKDLGDLLDHLGGYVHARWYLLQNLEDLENGIKYKTRAVALTPEDHLSRSRRFDNLGRSYLCKSMLDFTHDSQETLRLALDCFRQASHAVATIPLIKFTSACIWARSSLMLSLNESLEAYEVAFDLIPHVIWLGTTVAQRYQAIRELSNIAGEAASVAIKAQDYKRALEWLEQGQSIVMNQSIMLRSPLDDLQSIEPVMAEKLREVAEELQTVASRDPVRYNMLLSDISLGSPEKMADRHRQLAKEYADILAQVHRLPGFESFLKPKKASELVFAARTGPVVIINIYTPSNLRGVIKHSCDALILQPGESEIVHLALPNFDSHTSNKILSHFDTSILRGNPVERGVRRLKNNTLDLGNILALLWRDIVKPIIDFLGYKPSQHLDELPHITWCTVGALSFLPLHAAGTYGASKICVSDYAISSYTPSLTALLSSTTPSPATSILTVSQEQTPGSHSSLPGAARELAYIKEHARDVMSYTQLANEEATVEAVLDAMERHDCIHFACHAHQRVGDPTKSGFFLHDGTLSLVSILRRSFKNKGLAFLSACQTAMGDRDLPNETAHLASSVLIAGYPSVIATLWSIWDKDAPFLADKIYGALLKDGKLDCREAARALHFAVAQLRKEIGDDKFTRWVPFIHMGA